MLKHTILSLLACGLVMATESFENLPAGKLTGGETMYGNLSAAAGHAEIIKGKGRSGAAALHIMGGKEKSVTITLEKPLEKETPCDFWAERWTRRAPFDFVFIAVTPTGEQRLVHNNNMGVGGYHLHAEAKLPAGTTATRNPIFSASIKRLSRKLIVRTSPVSPTSPSTTASLRIGRFCILDTSAAIIPKSIAGSSTFKPPTTFKNIS